MTQDRIGVVTGPSAGRGQCVSACEAPLGIARLPPSRRGVVFASPSWCSEFPGRSWASRRVLRWFVVPELVLGGPREVLGEPSGAALVCRLRTGARRARVWSDSPAAGAVPLTEVPGCNFRLRLRYTSPRTVQARPAGCQPWLTGGFPAITLVKKRPSKCRFPRGVYTDP